MFLCFDRDELLTELRLESSLLWSELTVLGEKKRIHNPKAVRPTTFGLFQIAIKLLAPQLIGAEQTEQVRKLRPVERPR